MTQAEKLKKIIEEYKAELDMMVSCAGKLYHPNDPFYAPFIQMAEKMLLGLQRGRRDAELEAERRTPGIVDQMRAFTQGKLH